LDGYENVTDSLTVSGSDLEEEIYLQVASLYPSAAKGIKIYPNPAYDEVIIESPEAMTVKLTDLQGLTIIRKKMHHSIIRLNVSELSSGLYILHLHKNGVPVHVGSIMVR
jgi:hypothetical protein